MKFSASRGYCFVAILLAGFLAGCVAKDNVPKRISGNVTPSDSNSTSGNTYLSPIVDDKKFDPVLSSAVTLGADELTDGIPGDGPLTIEQIQDWLDDSQNHATLKVSLPMGLSLARANIVIPKDNPMTRAKIELGRQLYFERRLSADNTVSCADCHQPEEGFARHTQFGVGIKGQEGGRNSPISYNRILSGPQFWDGRAPSLEAQAVVPIASPIEMGNTHEQAVATLKKIEGYRMQFEKIFPEDSVTIDNVGKAIATFERAIVTGPTPYDYYEQLRTFEKTFAEELEDEETFAEEEPDIFENYQSLQIQHVIHPMNESAKRGRELFFSQRVGCTACHAGANFSDEKYHNLGVGMDKEKPDLGRYEESNDDKDRGAFKTPTVRNVTLSAPYMHDGSQKTLEEVVEWYSKGGHKNPSLSEKIKKIDLKDQEKKDLVEFMKSLVGKFPKIEQGRLPQ